MLDHFFEMLRMCCYLCRFFHEDVVVLEAHCYELFSLECRVGAGHGDNLCLFNAQVSGSIKARAQKLERAKLVELGENVLKKFVNKN